MNGLENNGINNTLTIIASGVVVLENECVSATVVIVNDRIHRIVDASISMDDIVAECEQSMSFSSKTIIDASSKYIFPGLIDIHCDAIEKEVQPRPNTLFPLEMSLLEFERKLPVHGITTMYHSLSLGVGLSLRGYHLVNELIELIHKYNAERSLVRNYIHLRYEVSYQDGLPYIERYIQDKLIHYLSYMDHSPGQGQYRQEGSFERYVMKNQGVTLAEVKGIVDALMEQRQAIDWDRLTQLSLLAKESSIAVASHDDDSYEKIDRAKSSGVTVSEFPITLEAAQYAVQQGLQVCVGAPNIVRGASHDHNLRAVDAIKEAGAQIICSDYHPSSMLQAVFKLEREANIPLHEAVKLATLHPADAMGIAEEVGSIAKGKKADIIIVDQFHELPFVEMTIVNGNIVYTSQPYFKA
ncbi:alpha-D-ribose 1-methylphosphonate 5-triphosphate diphosphatase [Paenibacillus sp. FSL W7-1287]|uniref:alpha-D-ribose 1-methylphosphonate 5-triphosphate diphosphatase n=1 Tax=Paenibacillus sp. FSL W7-1287 TaxID=2954538 RepID=UPI0030F72012|nr:alpha-D-ribose 1-methylphosphonate 5-triphosphate diphosphatase [Paenibacillus camelliae]